MDRTDSNVIGRGSAERFLSEQEVRDIAVRTFAEHDLTNERVLVIIPDGTRTAPIPQFFRLFHELLHGKVKALDYLVALGTHPLMSDEALLKLVGITEEERRGRYADIGIFNHLWSDPRTFVTLGTISAEETGALSNGLMAIPVDVRVNRMVLEYDHIVILGPVFPHEVVGFSGGNKYFFPGIGGPEVINYTHWLGALLTNYAIIGTRPTPVRAAIDRAASFIDRPKLCFALVVTEEGLNGLYTGTPEAAWEAATRLSAEVHIKYVDRPFEKILSLIPEMYGDMWVGAKGMYKMEPAAADGGEVILFAPHITSTSYVHGHQIEQIGYHVRDYFVRQWDRFKDFPWGVLAHSTHVRGSGSFEDGVERPRVNVTFATGIPRELCERLNVGYRDPATINPADFVNKEHEGILVVPHAGQVLYRVRDNANR
ncbi:MAG TPA: lactate racemase domain-containing protein [Rhodothermales bacterium]